MSAAPETHLQQLAKLHESTQDTKETDQQVALSIGALAGIPTRDRRGNVLDALWVKYSEQSVVGMLLETNDIRKILLGQIEDQLKARKDLIQEIEQHEIVCQWLMQFTAAWEREYSKQIVAQFDVGQLILSAMSEAYFEVVGLLDHASGFRSAGGAQAVFKAGIARAVEHFDTEKQNNTKQLLELQRQLKVAETNLEVRIAIITNPATGVEYQNILIAKEREQHAMSVRDLNIHIELCNALINKRIHKGDEAAVRLLFRHPDTRSLMCRIAGAMLRKQEVCNRSGGYSAKVQRNDISQQKNAALDTFCAWILKSHERLHAVRELLSEGNEPALLQHITDHKGSQTYSDGLHLSHVRA